VLLIDAANVVGSRPDGWWRDRAGAARRLVDQIRASDLPRPIVVVLEGAARRGVEEGVADEVEVVHARGEGDDTLAALAAKAATTDEPVTVVTADRGLADRVRRTGAKVVGSRWLLDQLSQPTG
jgi:predicted RNA-binding protein with PIN domain